MQRRSRRPERVIGTGVGVPSLVIQVGRQHRLVELHRFGAGIGERSDQLPVDGEHPAEQRQAIGPPIVGSIQLGQQQERHRAEQHRPGVDTRRRGLGELRQRFGGAGTDERCQLEMLVHRQLRHDVVVVGIEPLGHLERGDRGVVEPATTCSGEVAGQIDAAFGRAVALRQGAKPDRGIEHVVVQRKVIGRDQLDSGVALKRPVPTPKLGSSRKQLLLSGVAPPVPLQGSLQLALGTHPGKAKVGSESGHGGHPFFERLIDKSA